MKKIKFIYFLFLISGTRCTKIYNSTAQSDVIYNLKVDKSSVLADGTSQLHISCSLDSMATPDKQGILFKIDSGKFLPGGDTILIQPAQFVGQSLVANAVVQVPQTPGILIISAQPNLPGTQNNNYIKRHRSFIAFHSGISCIKR